VTNNGIYGSDLHTYDRRTRLEKGAFVGHAIMGVISRIGSTPRNSLRPHTTIARTS
jgi:threonine dehydrogenase-like Zn-dependent dehydrogenase